MKLIRKLCLVLLALLGLAPGARAQGKPAASHCARRIFCRVVVALPIHLPTALAGDAQPTLKLTRGITNGIDFSTVEAKLENAGTKQLEPTDGLVSASINGVPLTELNTKTKWNVNSKTVGVLYPRKEDIVIPVGTTYQVTLEVKLKGGGTVKVTQDLKFDKVGCCCPPPCCPFESLPVISEGEGNCLKALDAVRPFLVVLYRLL